MEQKKLSRKFWIALCLFSLMGQIAWVVENMYFNVFIYKIFSADADAISFMVAMSAVSATLTTVFIGALSDRVGKRKLFIVGGYILWGISILSFSLIRLDVIHALFPMAASAASVGITLVILMDCVMTFFGSSANDAAFNAWLTDSTDDKNRGKAEGFNAMMPLVAILAVFGGFMSFNLDSSESWTTIFLIIGVVVILIGVLGIFLIEEPPTMPDRTGYLKTVFYGFSPKTYREHRRLYFCFLLFVIFNISIQIFMPYLIIYYEVSLKMTDYVLIMAPAIVLASIVTALWGRVYDKKGFRFSALFALIWLLLGYLILFLFRTTVPVFFGSLLMMSGYLSGMAVFGAQIRDHTPQGKAGRLQGIRIFSQVLLPGVIGPFIGNLVLKNAEYITNSDGTQSFVPSANIFLASAVPAALLLIAVFLFVKKERGRTRELKTPYQVAELPHHYHPSPRMQREDITLLNGMWQFSVERRGKTVYDGMIRVPFPPESALSLVARITESKDILVYTRRFTYAAAVGKRLLLHFGAVDTEAEVFVNGASVGTHTGGYTPFTLDITDSVLHGQNSLCVRVRDALDPIQPYGKQRRKPGGMWYTPISGIWQSVWLETVPEKYIKSIKVSTTLDKITIFVAGGEQEKLLFFDGKEYRFSGESITVTPDNICLWTPETPTLYRFAVKSGEDTVSSYCAMREIGSKAVNGKTVLTLNRKPYFFHGLLDQGYYADGIYTPASEEGYKNDILEMKKLGFNMLRKHIKVEPEIFYYYCDLYGMAVFQDMVNNGRYSFFYDTALPTLGLRMLPKRQPKRVNEAFLKNALEVQELLYSHPSVLYYTVYNEGWGQDRRENAYRLLKARDPSRIYDAASGWFGKMPSDVQSEHIYFKRADFSIESERPAVLSEFGGYSCVVDGHAFHLNKVYGYKLCKDTAVLTADLRRLYIEEILPLAAKGLSASVLTQLSDVEDETNGILTYDRAVLKPDVKEMQEIAERLKNAFYAFTAEQ